MTSPYTGLEYSYLQLLGAKDKNLYLSCESKTENMTDGTQKIDKEHLTVMEVNIITTQHNTFSMTFMTYMRLKYFRNRKTDLRDWILNVFQCISPNFNIDIIYQQTLMF